MIEYNIHVRVASSARQTQFLIVFSILLPYGYIVVMDMGMDILLCECIMYIYVCEI